VGAATLPESQIVGREAELEALRAFLQPGFAPAALVLTGEPRIGKTTLWEAPAAQGAGAARRARLGEPPRFGNGKRPCGES
jgi:hypothetical protein